MARLFCVDAHRDARGTPCDRLRPRRGTCSAATFQALRDAFDAKASQRGAVETDVVSLIETWRYEPVILRNPDQLVEIGGGASLFARASGRRDAGRST
jgi:hypothetical protein